MFGLFIVFKNAPVNCHSTLIWQYLARACPKTICSAHFVASLCRTLCRTVRFLAIFDKVGRQSARQRSRTPFVGQALATPSLCRRLSLTAPGVKQLRASLNAICVAFADPDVR